jgi:peroxiredoxin Q/BCP
VGHQVADAFGVWVDKKYMGRSYQGVERSSFIVGPDGRIEHVLERVKPMEHVDLVLEALAA